MMTEEMLKNMPHMMMNGASHVMKKPLTSGAMMAGAGFAAGKGQLEGLAISQEWACVLSRQDGRQTCKGAITSMISIPTTQYVL